MLSQNHLFLVLVRFHCFVCVDIHQRRPSFLHKCATVASAAQHKDCPLNEMTEKEGIDVYSVVKEEDMAKSVNGRQRE